MQNRATAISVGTVAVTVVPARSPSSPNAPLGPLPNTGRLNLLIQSFGSPEYPNNPTIWIAFGQTAVVGGAGSIQLTTGGTFERGVLATEINALSSVCPQEYISVVAQSAGALGSIIELLG